MWIVDNGFIHLFIESHSAVGYGGLEHLLELAHVEGAVTVDVVYPEEELYGRVGVLAGELRQRLDILVHDDAAVLLPVEDGERAVDEKLLQCGLKDKY